MDDYQLEYSSDQIDYPEVNNDNIQNDDSWDQLFFHDYPEDMTDAGALASPEIDPILSNGDVSLGPISIADQVSKSIDVIRRRVDLTSITSGRKQWQFSRASSNRCL